MSDKTLKCPLCDYEAPESDFLEISFPISEDINSQYQIHKRMKSRGLNIVICPICYKAVEDMADEFYKLTKIHIPVEVHYFADFVDVEGSHKALRDLYESIPVPPDITDWKKEAGYRYDYLKQKYDERALELFKKLYIGVIDIPKSYD